MSSVTPTARTPKQGEGLPSPNTKAAKFSESKYTEVTRISSSSFKPPMSKESLLKKKAQTPQSDSSLFSAFSYIKHMFTGKVPSDSSTTKDNKTIKNVPVKKTAVKETDIAKPTAEKEEKVTNLLTNVDTSELKPYVSKNRGSTLNSTAASTFDKPNKTDSHRKASPSPQNESGNGEDKEMLKSDLPNYTPLRFVNNRSTYLHTPDKRGTTSFRITTAPKTSRIPMPTLLSPTTISAQSPPVKKTSKKNKKTRKRSASPRTIAYESFQNRLRSRSTPESPHTKLQPVSLSATSQNHPTIKFPSEKVEEQGQNSKEDKHKVANVKTSPKPSIYIKPTILREMPPTYKPNEITTSISKENSMSEKKLEISKQALRTNVKVKSPKISAVLGVSKTSSSTKASSEQKGLVLKDPLTPTVLSPTVVPLKKIAGYVSYTGKDKKSPSPITKMDKKPSKIKKIQNSKGNSPAVKNGPSGKKSRIGIEPRDSLWSLESPKMENEIRASDLIPVRYQHPYPDKNKLNFKRSLPVPELQDNNLLKHQKSEPQLIGSGNPNVVEEPVLPKSNSSAPSVNIASKLSDRPGKPKLATNTSPCIDIAQPVKTPELKRDSPKIEKQASSCPPTSPAVGVQPKSSVTAITSTKKSPQNSTSTHTMKHEDDNSPISRDYRYRNEIPRLDHAKAGIITQYQEGNESMTPKTFSYISSHVQDQSNSSSYFPPQGNFRIDLFVQDGMEFEIDACNSALPKDIAETEPKNSTPTDNTDMENKLNYPTCLLKDSAGKVVYEIADGPSIIVGKQITAGKDEAPDATKPTNIEKLGPTPEPLSKTKTAQKSPGVSWPRSPSIQLKKPSQRKNHDVKPSSSALLSLKKKEVLQATAANTFKSTIPYRKSASLVSERTKTKDSKMKRMIASPYVKPTSDAPDSSHAFRRYLSSDRYSVESPTVLEPTILKSAGVYNSSNSPVPIRKRKSLFKKTQSSLPKEFIRNGEKNDSSSFLKSAFESLQYAFTGKSPSVTEASKSPKESPSVSKKIQKSLSSENGDKTSKSSPPIAKKTSLKTAESDMGPTKIVEKPLSATVTFIAHFLNPNSKGETNRVEKTPDKQLKPTQSPNGTNLSSGFLKDKSSPIVTKDGSDNTLARQTKPIPCTTEKSAPNPKIPEKENKVASLNSVEGHKKPLSIFTLKEKIVEKFFKSEKKDHKNPSQTPSIGEVQHPGVPKELKATNKPPRVTTDLKATDNHSPTTLLKIAASKPKLEIPTVQKTKDPKSAQHATTEPKPVQTPKPAPMSAQAAEPHNKIEGNRGTRKAATPELSTRPKPVQNSPVATNAPPKKVKDYVSTLDKLESPRRPRKVPSFSTNPPEHASCLTQMGELP